MLSGWASWVSSLQISIFCAISSLAFYLHNDFISIESSKATKYSESLLCPRACVYFNVSMQTKSTFSPLLNTLILYTEVAAAAAAAAAVLSMTCPTIPAKWEAFGIVLMDREDNTENRFIRHLLRKSVKNGMEAMTRGYGSTPQMY
ncbi:hypothetical protein EGR_10914 [Echinococcus granulosus]|uniref:Uncharacterized protein n=1 Tax=Echinococcus granulosus TaxID=6210 RepID=W6TZP9_ECHGR|nr:hypothetical protein EGR_10914 [Echinococcus granulosus]EUB54223.1 hypothetical protein EGR_10914 [Echinococcus granulosus]